MKHMVYALPLIVMDAEDLSKSYSIFRTAPISCISSVHITNDSNIPIIFSYDGFEEHDVIAKHSRIKIDFPTNKGFLKMNGYYVRTESSGSGKIYIATYALHTGV